MKIGDNYTYTQEMIGGGEVWILPIKLGPLRCFVFIGMEHSGECSHKRLIEAINEMIGDTCLILDVEMELMQVGGPLLMVVVLQFPLCLYQLQRLVINMYDHLFSHNVIFPLMTRLYNEIHFLVIGGVFLDSTRECLTRWMPMLSENHSHNIVRCINLNLEWLMKIE
jgi:hypothetical protein